MQTHAHPRSGEVIKGVRLPAGTLIRGGDLYDSKGGGWHACHLYEGARVPRGDHVVWIRQPNPLSPNALVLLGHLCQARFGKACIGESNRTFYIIPSPTFNWDGRFELHQVMHPECVEELVDHGLLVYAEYEATGWWSDYSTVWMGHMNHVYTLTDEGRREGAHIIT